MGSAGRRALRAGRRISPLDRSSARPSLAILYLAGGVTPAVVSTCYSRGRRTRLVRTNVIEFRRFRPVLRRPESTVVYSTRSAEHLDVSLAGFCADFDHRVDTGPVFRSR